LTKSWERYHQNPVQQASAFQQFHALSDLLIREFGSFAVFELVSFFFMPFMRAQKESRRDPPSGCGALRCPPVALL
jgi:hypothetical protein